MLARGRSATDADAARAVGGEIGRRWQLGYDGGRPGPMVTVVEAALAAGARVVGVIPASLMQCELGHPGRSDCTSSTPAPALDVDG